MKVLLLEDNHNLSEIIKDILEVKGLEVDLFDDGEEALEHIQDGYDCFILDINVPRIDGLSLLKEIRDRNKDTPTIIISSNIELDTIKKAYIAGCNDFLKKPFYTYELEAKIDLLCQKITTIKLADDYVYDMVNESLYDAKSNYLKLTRKEKRFLTLLLKNPNQMVPLSAIEQYVWEGEFATLPGIRSMVKRLRSKLPEKIIVTHNYGYLIKV